MGDGINGWDGSRVNLSGQQLPNNNNVEQANALEPETPPLRGILRRTPHRHPNHIQLLLPTDEPVEKERPIGDGDGDGAVSQKPHGRTEDEDNLLANGEPSGSANQGFLLPRWIAEQERRNRDPEKDAIEKQNRALFTQQLLLSMLCDEELGLPEDDKPTEEKIPKEKPQHGLCKAMSLMSLPGTGLRQVAQGSGLWSPAVVDAPKDEAAPKEGAAPGTEEEEAID